MLLATSALAAAALPTTIVHATDAIWAPGDDNFNNDANWKDAAGAASATPDGTATFNASSQQQILFNKATTLGGISVTSGAGEYSFVTRNHDVTFNGTGLSVESGASLLYTVNGGSETKFLGGSTAGQARITVGNGLVVFEDGSSADRAQITVDTNGSVNFGVGRVGVDNCSAANAKIVTSGESSILFTGSCTADNASIEVHADAGLLFSEEASGGNASINLLARATFDITELVTRSGGASGTTVGSLEGSGTVFLGRNTLTVGGNDRTTTFDGRIQDGGGNLNEVGGSLVKVGEGALTLTGTSDYLGTTTVNGGTLIVDGDISLSSTGMPVGGVIVNAGGTLAGIGHVFTTTINDGGTLAPGHSDGTGGALNVDGDLIFTKGATYLVQVSSGGANRTKVSFETATLGGATVAAKFAPDATVTKQSYNILAAQGVVGQFNSVVKTNLSAIFTTSLSYDDPTNPTNVFLNVDVATRGSALAGLSTNQRNVSDALINALDLAGSLPGAFATLSPAGLTQVSGETAVGTQQATIDAMNQFMGVLLDPTLGVRGGQPKDAMAAMPRKAAPLTAAAFDSRWGVWAAGFGGSQSTSGDAVLGSNKTGSNVFGSAVGVDYRFSPNTVAGFALAGGGTHFTVDNGGSGNSDLFQAGAYVKHTQGAVFLAAALAYGWQDVTTNRNVTVDGVDRLRANFKTDAISGRLEGGYKIATGFGDITPYAAGQFTTYRLPSYAEQTAFGANTFALNYTGKDVTATRSELGLRGEKAVPLTDATLMLRGRLAWAHDYNTDRNVQASFQTLPGASFVVNGASPAADTALTTLAAETLWRNGWSASLTGDAQLSDSTHSYSGKGVVRYSW